MRVGITLVKPLARSPQRGVEALVWLADSPEVSGESGGYFADKRRATPSAAAKDAEAAGRLWEVSERQTQKSAAPGAAGLASTGSSRDRSSPREHAALGQV